LTAACAARQQQPASTDSLEGLRRDSEAIKPLLRTDVSRAFAAATSTLTHPGRHVVWRDKAHTRAVSDADYPSLDDAARAGLERQELDEEYYFTTKYGSPLSYVLPLELLKDVDARGLKLVDYGYGYVTHLKMLASLGADAHGVDADPLLPVLYAQEKDVTLHGGRFPEDVALTKTIGTGYGLFLSKNTLKMGFVHPSQPHDRTLKLKVSDDEYLHAVAELLAPHGLALVYNLYPAQKPDYIPWAEGKTPFTREAWERAGFEVLDFDRDDTPRAREIAKALGWDKGEDATDLDRDLFATYTLARKR
jgi:hypothetical protein